MISELILGCGISDFPTNTEENFENQIKKLLKSPNLILSDINHNGLKKYSRSIMIPIYDGFDIKKFFPKYKDIEKYQISDYKCNYIDEEMLKTRFINIDLLKEDDLEKINKKYDLIELRYVLHFKEFTDEKRFKIINYLYRNYLNSNGKIQIKMYKELLGNNLSNSFQEYNLLKYSEIKSFKAEYKEKIKIKYGVDKGFGKFCEIIIKYE